MTKDTQWLEQHGVRPADIVRVAGLIGEQRNGRIGGIEMLAQIRAYYEASIREQVAQEIEAVANSVVHGWQEPVFVDGAYVARHGSLHAAPKPDDEKGAE